MRIPRWLSMSLATALLWGVWGAFSEYPSKYVTPSFPSTLIAAVNALTIIPVALVSLKKIHWRPNVSLKAIGYGLAAGLTGAGGQLLLFISLRYGPAYLIFPIISLSPAITVICALAFLHEKAGLLSKLGIVFALAAIFLMAVQPPPDGNAHGYLWFIFSIAIFLMWGIQAYVIKASTRIMDEDSMFFYLALTLQLIIPAGILLTDFSQPINWGFQGPWLSAIIQFMNTLGVLFFVYALKDGKAIIVTPLVNGAYPLITILLSLAIYRQLPYWPNAIGMVAAIIAILLISYDEGRQQTIQR